MKAITKLNRSQTFFPKPLFNATLVIETFRDIVSVPKIHIIITWGDDVIHKGNKPGWGW